LPGEEFVSSKKDISQIKKYLNGELDARAMHQLERRALDDPFLMDALEGYEHAGGDQQASLDELANRLQQRTDQQVRRMIPWVPLSIAASILIILGIGLLLITNNQHEKKKEIAAVVKPANQDQGVMTPSALPKNDTLASGIKPGRAVAYSKTLPDTVSEKLASNNAANEVVVPMSAATQQTLKNYKAGKDSMALNELVVSNYDFKKRKDTINTTADILRKVPPVTQYQTLQGKVDGATITNQPTAADRNKLYGLGIIPPGNMADKDIARPNFKSKANDTSALKGVPIAGYAAQRKKDAPGSVTTVSATPLTPGTRITGKIISRDDGQPIIGATVKIVGSTYGVVTDVTGRFVLPNAPGDQTLAIAYIGYSPEHIKVNGRDSLNVALNPNNASLSEVVVTTPKEAAAGSENAHPVNGWAVFKDYLKLNAVSTDGATGKVRLSFMVDNGGNLSGFKIIKSLGKVADQKAIDMVQYGPKWMGNANGKPEEIKITIKFH